MLNLLPPISGIIPAEFKLVFRQNITFFLGRLWNVATQPECPIYSILCFHKFVRKCQHLCTKYYQLCQEKEAFNIVHTGSHFLEFIATKTKRPVISKFGRSFPLGEQLFDSGSKEGLASSRHHPNCSINIIHMVFNNFGHCP